MASGSGRVYTVHIWSAEKLTKVESASGRGSHSMGKSEEVVEWMVLENRDFW